MPSVRFCRMIAGSKRTLPPLNTPLALASTMPSRCRSRMRPRSNSAIPAITVNMSLDAAVGFAHTGVAVAEILVSNLPDDFGIDH